MGNKTKPDKSSAYELRRRAEERLSAQPPMVPDSDAENRRLLHELQVHQIELEMQNEELRHSREELESALDEYSELYDFAPVGYLTLDRKGAIRKANITATSLLHTDRSRLIGMPIASFVATPDLSALTTFLDKVFSNIEREACEVALRKKGVPELFVRIEGATSPRAEECLVVLIDVTERRLAERALREAKEAAEAATRAKGLFLSNMSHELRTPMNGILGMLQHSLEEELSPAIRECLEISLRSARSLLRIMGDILDMGRIETGKLYIEEQPFPLRQCIAEAADLFTTAARCKGIGLEVSMEEDVPHMAMGDQTRLRQVIVNLVGNAVKFTDAGKVTLRVETCGRSADRKQKVFFRVTDTGIGIPEEKKHLIFQAFSQVDTSHSRLYGGTGLGLAISREIVELMGGTISFESRDGEGSTFTFTIPLGEDRQEQQPSAAGQPQPAAAPAGEGGGRILFAEDDPANRKVLGLLLKRAKYEVEYAENGLEAVEMWEAGGYDLVLMDVQMPHMDGYDATRAIRERERERGGHTPIVAMTAHARKQDEEMCLAAGMDAYLSKPIDFKECLRVIGDAIGKKGG